MKIAIVVSGIILLAVSTASAAALGAVCDVEADYALGLKNYPEAIKLHQQLITLHPGNALAHYHLAFAYGMMGRGEDEIDEYLAAVALGDDDWDLYLNLGLAYLEKGKIEESIQSLKHGLLIASEHYELHLDLAIAYERSGRLAEALQAISTALSLNPKDPEVRNVRAAVYAELGELRRAHDEWKLLALTAPDYAPARDNLELLENACPEGPDLSRWLETAYPSSLRQPVGVFCNRVRRR